MGGGRETAVLRPKTEAGTIGNYWISNSALRVASGHPNAPEAINNMQGYGGAFVTTRGHERVLARGEPLSERTKHLLLYHCRLERRVQFTESGHGFVG
jgi:hypothetical protein